jgi:hypothetical protein
MQGLLHLSQALNGNLDNLKAILLPAESSAKTSETCTLQASTKEVEGEHWWIDGIDVSEGSLLEEVPEGVWDRMDLREPVFLTRDSVT